MARVKDMLNPLGIKPGQMLTHEETLYVRKLQRVRQNARKAARSGHPGRRAEGKRVLGEVPNMIRTVYIQNALKG